MRINISSIKQIDKLEFRHKKWGQRTNVEFANYILKIKQIIILCLLLIASKSFAEPFPIYDALLYNNKPDLSKYGLLYIRMVYESQMWLPGDNKDLPNETQIYKIAKKLKPNTIVCIDIEHWPTKGASEIVNQSIAKYKKVLSIYRKKAPKVALGYYSVIPRRDYYRARKVKGLAAFDEWKKENDRLIELAQDVDIVFPSLYTFNPNMDAWKMYALENIKEARKYGKPVCAFLSPTFHESSFINRGNYMSADFWRFQLETCYKYADGIVIWGGWQKNWNENLPWWKETKRFLDKMKNGNIGKKMRPPILKNLK